MTLPGTARPARIVVLGDIHGSLDGLISILRVADLIDSQGNWSGHKTVLVQVGDLLDRGPDDRAVMDLFMKLQDQADEAGGEVIVLLGNHEAMNLMGDLRYVTRESYAGFADEDSEKRIRKLRENTVRFLKRRSAELRQPKPDFSGSWEEEWNTAHPPGFAEHRQAFNAKGTYGKWLRKLPAIARLDDIVFAHAGISPQLSDQSVDAINRRIAKELKTFDRYRRYLENNTVILFEFSFKEMLREVRSELAFAIAGGTRLSLGRNVSRGRHREILEAVLGNGGWYSVNPNGPLWFRGYATWDEETGRKEVEKILRSLQASHLIVGHTPQLPGRIRARFGKRVILVDSGLNSDYFKGGRPLALEISGPRFTVISLDGREELSDGSELLALDGTK